MSLQLLLQPMTLTKEERKSRHKKREANRAKLHAKLSARNVPQVKETDVTGSTGFVPGFTQVLTSDGYRYLGEDKKPREYHAPLGVFTLFAMMGRKPAPPRTVVIDVKKETL